MTREEELAEGHEELRFTGYLAVSAPSVYELELACKEVQRQASEFWALASRPWERATAPGS